MQTWFWCEEALTEKKIGPEIDGVVSDGVFTSPKDITANLWGLRGRGPSLNNVREVG